MNTGYLLKISDYSYIIVPRTFPYFSSIRIYEGDEIRISIKGINNDSDETPFNFSTYSDFKFCFKEFAESSIEYCSTSDNILLAQSEEAIEYDQDNNLPLGTTLDEIHIIDEDYSILRDFKGSEVYTDIQMKLGDSNYTLFKFKITIENQITE